MLKVVEIFSGIGAQAAALRNIGIDFQIIATADWDVNAIIAYDLIHNGKPVKSKYDEMPKEKLLSILKQHTLSLNGKEPATLKQLENHNIEFLSRLCAAIDRSKQMISVTDINGKNIPDDTDLLTYSFPCQDLSSAGFWCGNKSGIARDANNKSSMLWQIERILLERLTSKKSMPKFLLMENVPTITSKRNIKNFNEWIGSLKKIGYESYQMLLNAKDFGIPQKRKRMYMISIYTKNNKKIKDQLDDYFTNHNLQDENYLLQLNLKKKKIQDLLKLNYKNEIYKQEADCCQPNDTKSRQNIWNDNVKLYHNNQIQIQILPTLTTKQDRHPNSGVIEYPKKTGKSAFRYLTPRESFMVMGFKEKDFDAIISNNFVTRNGKSFFTRDKLYRMAGNSIVVCVLEQIFIQINEINNIFFEKKNK